MDQISNGPNEGTDAEGYGPERMKPRDSLFLMSILNVIGSTRETALPVRVRNLAPGGLMAEYPRGLDEGTAVEFDLRGVGWVNGTVAWSSEGRIGVSFERPIDPLAARKPVGGAKSK
ncbi:PilZ domain-containing protein [Sphingomonas immobilis]|jgi:hypothetical protein|uniref:PilZ domain-containing protein n=1 Tax=Sphingomonas immobilis TaxID=3063997 RepID=A0ABT9A581_9SPHN|nr:PilZ domain-containing protein [Sphingomonas sp. CA1-15]MDO7844385.1 PilZ domain-containing protein [Sphingomonas sp. CA1-15]